MRAAQRRAEQEARREAQQFEREYNREVDRVNRENKRRADEHSRKVEAHNRQVDREYKRAVEAENRRIEAHNKKVIENLNRQLEARDKAFVADINRQLRAASTTGPTYTAREAALADRLQTALPPRDERELDAFLSYAKIDGEEVGEELVGHLDELGARVWFAPVSIEPGKSQALQIDKGLVKSRAGIVLLTPAFVAGRFWTERELGPLLGKDTLIPVLHKVTFEQVAEYSGVLPDLAGFETARDSVEVIAQKIAAALLNEAD